MSTALDTVAPNWRAMRSQSTASLTSGLVEHAHEARSTTTHHVRSLVGSALGDGRPHRIVGIGKMSQHGAPLACAFACQQQQQHLAERMHAHSIPLPFNHRQYVRITRGFFYLPFFSSLIKVVNYLFK